MSDTAVDPDADASPDTDGDEGFNWGVPASGSDVGTDRDGDTGFEWGAVSRTADPPCAIGGCVNRAARPSPWSDGSVDADDTTAAQSRSVCRPHYWWLRLRTPGTGILAAVIGIAGLMLAPFVFPGPDLLIAPVGFLIGIGIGLVGWTLVLRGVDAIIRRA